MPDLDDRMRALDEVGSPDLWSRIEDREPSPRDDGGRRRGGGVVRKGVLVVTTLAVAGAAVAFAAVSFEGSRPQPTPTGPAATSTTTPVVPVANGPLLFAAGRPSRIYVVNPDGTGLHAISPPSLVASQPAVTTDGRRVAFVADAAIWTMDVDGSHVRRLTGSDRVTHGPSEIDGQPAWSPDGNRIAFVATVEPGGCASLVVMDADASERHAITGCTGGSNPAWAPDGLAIATAGRNLNRAGARGVWVMNADGTGGLLLPGTDQDDSLATWSPDGAHIAFWRGDTIGSQPATGSSRPPRILATCDVVGCGAGATGLTFSPDGRGVAFTEHGRLYTAPRGSGSGERVRLPAGMKTAGVAWAAEVGTGRLLPATEPVVVTRTFDGGKVACVASTPSPAEPGSELRVRMVLENQTGTTVQASEVEETNTSILDSSGAELWNYGRSLGSLSSGPPPEPPAPLQPWGGALAGANPAPVEWSGSLRVRVICLGSPMPDLRVAVAVPGPTPTADQAAASAANATNGVLSGCVPTPDGRWVEGTVHPSGSDPFAARCRAVVVPRDGFDFVRLDVVAPPDASGVPFGRYFIDTLDRLPSGGDTVIVAIQWRFVVMAEGVGTAEYPEAIAAGCGGTEWGSLSVFGSSSNPWPIPGPCRH